MLGGSSKQNGLSYVLMCSTLVTASINTQDHKDFYETNRIPSNGVIHSSAHLLDRIRLARSTDPKNGKRENPEAMNLHANKARNRFQANPCINVTNIPDNIKKFPLISKYDETKDNPIHCCGCNYNEYLFEWCSSSLQPTLRTCKQCGEDEYLHEYAHKETKCKKKETHNEDPKEETIPVPTSLIPTAKKEFFSSSNNLQSNYARTTTVAYFNQNSSELEQRKPNNIIGEEDEKAASVPAGFVIAILVGFGCLILLLSILAIYYRRKYKYPEKKKSRSRWPVRYQKVPLLTCFGGKSSPKVNNHITQSQCQQSSPLVFQTEVSFGSSCISGNKNEEDAKIMDTIEYIFACSDVFYDKDVFDFSIKYKLKKIANIANESPADRFCRVIRASYDDGKITHKDVVEYFNSRGWLTAYHELIAHFYVKSEQRNKQTCYTNPNANEALDSTSSNGESSSDDVTAAV